MNTFNHAENFLRFVTEAHIVYLVLKLCEMDDMNAVPRQVDTMQSAAELSQFFNELCQRVVQHVWLLPPITEVSAVVDCTVDTSFLADNWCICGQGMSASIHRYSRLSYYVFSWNTRNWQCSLLLLLHYCHHRRRHDHRDHRHNHNHDNSLVVVDISNIHCSQFITLCCDVCRTRRRGDGSLFESWLLLWCLVSRYVHERWHGSSGRLVVQWRVPRHSTVCLLSLQATERRYVFVVFSLHFYRFFCRAYNIWLAHSWLSSAVRVSG